MDGPTPGNPVLRPVELVPPTAALGASYRALVAEFVARGEKLVPFTLAFAHDDVDALVAQLAACARGEGPAAGFVAHSSFWLVRDGTDVVGVANVRHALTPGLRLEGGHIGYSVRPSARGQGLATELLRRTLAQARTLGIAPALLTCAKANAASAAVIRRNGGVFAGEEFLADRGEVVQRYWIPAPPPGAA